ncbi:MAG: LptF/LptG family permease [Candidatus Kapabacteria bacterium]|nr:LptF/LptG family permease [Candidatus Kapabacteria bacterium]
MKRLHYYMIKRFISTFLFALLAMALLFIIVDLFEHLENFLDREVFFIKILEYYMYYIPDILKLVIPIATLMAVLFSVGMFSSNNEITAMKSGGMSLYSIMLPFVIASLALSIFQLYFSSEIVPKSNKIKNTLGEVYFGRSSRTVYLSNLYIRDNPTKIVNFREYDANRNRGYSLQVNTFSGTNSPRLVETIRAENFYWDSVTNNWKLIKIKKQVFAQGNIIESRIDSMNYKFSFNQKELTELAKPFDEMTFREQDNYLKFQQKGGKDIRKELTNYYGTIAFPFANFIVILFGVPFASIKQKGGIAIQISAALIISFLYIIFAKLGQIIGYSLQFPPLLSAWLANGIFFLGGLFVLYKTPK